MQGAEWMDSSNYGAKLRHFGVTQKRIHSPTLATEARMGHKGQSRAVTESGQDTIGAFLWNLTVSYNPGLIKAKDCSMSKERAVNEGFHTRAARRYLRRKLDMRIRVAVQAESNEFVSGRCITVSEGGFGAIMSGELPDGGAVWVEFRSAKVPPEMRFKAEVRQRRGFQYGFQFVAPSPKHKIIIRQIFAEGADFV